MKNAEKEAEWAEFREVATQEGLDEHVEDLVRLCVPSLRLVAAKRAPSRIGGVPRVPEGFTWPTTSSGEPLAFVAALDLAAVHATRMPGVQALPARGVLAFFYGLESADGEHAGNAGRVFHFDDTTPLVELAAPAGSEALPSIPVTLEVGDEQLPPLETPFYAVLLGAAGSAPADDPYARAFEVFEDFVDAYGQAGVRDEDERPVHRVLGYADPLQADVYATTEGNAAKRPTAEWTELDHLRAAARWRLLLQVDSDPARGLLFGDGGVLAFLIRDEDLAARRFDRAWVEWQSH